MPFAELTESKIYWEQHGSGEDIIFIHGAGGNSLSWWQQIAEFRRHYTCTVYDARGWGRSIPKDNISHDRGVFGRDLADLIQELGIRKSHIVAQSMGGRAVIGLLQTAPQTVRSLTLCGTTAGATNDRIRELQDSLKVARANKKLYEYSLSPSFTKNNVPLATLYHQLRRLNPPRNKDVLGRPPKNYKGSTHEILTGIARPDTSIKTHQIPVLYVVGEHDKITSPEMIKEAATLVKHSKIREFKDAGHSVYFEQADKFNALLHEFFQETEVTD